MVSIAYKELRNQSPKFAREIVRRVLKENGGNVSKVARILGISRHTVRRARDGELEDQSRRPKKIPRKTDTFLEKLIVKEGERTGYRYRRLTKYMSRKYGLKISENTVKAILKRNGIKKKRRRTGNGKVRDLYDYEHMEPLWNFN
ncbi:MAG: hypothetical protein OHK0040_11880 [bacterium]